MSGKRELQETVGDGMVIVSGSSNNPGKPGTKSQEASAKVRLDCCALCVRRLKAPIAFQGLWVADFSLALVSWRVGKPQPKKGSHYYTMCHPLKRSGGNDDEGDHDDDDDDADDDDDDDLDDDDDDDDDDAQKDSYK